MKSLVFIALLWASTVYSQSAMYEQCGGSLWTGSTSCASDTTCQVQNPYYSQCLPGAGSASDGSSVGQSGAMINYSNNASSADLIADSSTSGSNSGDSNTEGSGTNLGAVASSTSAAVAASSPAPRAAASSQPAPQEGTTGGFMNSGSSTGDTGVGNSGGGSSGGSSGGGSFSGGSSGGNSSAQPASGGACVAYTGDKTGVASTTHYYDSQKGACGCGSGNGMAQWQSGAGGSNIFTAAGSPNLFGGSSTWCGSGCGQCYELKNLGALPTANMGDCTGSGDTITVMITNLCPSNGNEQWCSVPDAYGFPAHFDIMSQGGPNGWNNPVVSYKQVTCPGSLTSDYASCQCASGQTSRARRGLFGETNFGY